MQGVRANAVVTPKGARRWADGHPWIFRSDIKRSPGETAGAVTVLDTAGRELGCALWSPRSEIALRMLDRNPAAALDQDWWTQRIGAAIARRASIGANASAYRLVHGEGDFLPSLVVDRYADWLVVQLLSAGIETFRGEILAALQSLVPSSGILARNDVAVREREGLPRQVELLHGEVPRDVEVHEYGVRYFASPWDGQKTGAFLDQRENRALMASLTRGNALDCFSYHGSFSLHLARAAAHVTAIDSSGPALERARRNLELNSFRNVETVEANSFDYLRDLEREGRRFDTIILDPPAFAKNRAALHGAVRGYKDINLWAMRLLAPGGLLFTASCSFHLSRSVFMEMLADAAADAGRPIRVHSILGQPLDHPEILSIPETGYLKAAILEAVH